MNARSDQKRRMDFPVVARYGRHSSPCRGMELSSSGILLDRGRSAPFTDHSFIKLELVLPGLSRPFEAVAQPIWSFGTQHALKFVGLTQADHLLIARHVDRLLSAGTNAN